MSQLNQPIQNSSNNNNDNNKNVESLHEMKQSVKDALCGARAFYIGMHLFTLGMMTLYQNDISQQLAQRDAFSPYFYLALVALSCYFFWTCGINPGYAPYDLDIEMQHNHFDNASSTGIQINNNNNEDGEGKQNLLESSPHSSSKYKTVIPQNSLALAASCDQQLNKYDQQGSNADNQYDDEEKKSHSNEYQNDYFDEIENINEKIQMKIGKRHSDVVHTNYKQERTAQLSQHYNQHLSEHADPLQHKNRNHSASQLSQEIHNSFPEEIIHSDRTSGIHSLRQSRQTNESDQNEQLDAVAQQYYCHICKRHQPLRSKHCFDCGRCINKYDHHCFWIGGCVGELNHRKFWIFLFLQSVVIVWTFINSLDALDRYYIVDENGQESYSQEYGAFAVLCFVLFVLLLFTGVLWIYHTFLILTNQTTWEHVKRQKISYISKLPKGFYPFNQGVCSNISIIFCHNNQLTDWKVPTLREAREKHKNTFNAFENEYYSCC